MPKPTRPQPPGLTEPRIMDRCPGCGSQSLFLGTGGLLTCSVIGCKAVSLAMWLEKARRAGCEAQRKVDAALVREAREKRATVQVFDVLADLIERTPEQPTTQRCGTCGSDDPRLVQTQKGMAEQSIDALCPNKRFHSQPTTGEAGDGL